LLIGATGLVGSHLLKLLLADSRFDKVIVFSRRTLNVVNPKLEEHIIDFDQPDRWKHLVSGDVFFSALGTTMKQAGSQSAQFSVDYTYQFQFAQAAETNGLQTYVLVSSSGANPDSRIFYSRIKGELERDVKKLSFASVSLIRPSLLAGHRDKERAGEKIGYAVLRTLNAVGLFRKYKPISGETVARAMINAAIAGTPGVQVYELEKVFSLAAY